MRTRIFWGLYGLTACQAPSGLGAKPIIHYVHLSFSAETLPVWSDTCLQKAQAFSHWAVSLILQRDRVLDVPEWVSGHRLALAAACEIFSPELLIVEAPPGDSLFYPGDSAAREAWQSALRSWLLDELLPMLSNYPSLRRVAWGRGFAQLPLRESFWKDLVRAARQAAPDLQWGLVVDTPIPHAPTEWDFLGRFVQTKMPPESIAPKLPDKPILYFLLGKTPIPDDLSSLGSDPMGYVLYSESHLPVICR